MKDKRINISSLKLDFKNLRHTFWAHKYRMQQKLDPNFLQVGAFGNSIGKEL